MAKRKGGFGKYKIHPDPAMAKIVGTSKPITPAEMTKRNWAYIKRKKLGRK